jgi:hypothetical protein
MYRVARWPLFLLTLAALGGCAMYHPYNGSSGYSDALVAPGQYEVNFVTPSDGTTTQAMHLAIVRAAELAVLSDHPYFELLQSQGAIRQSSSYFPPTIDWYNGVYTSRRGERIFVNQPYWTPGYVDYYAQPQAVLQVKMLAAPTPTALEARQVLADAVREGIKISPDAAARAGLAQKK